MKSYIRNITVAAIALAALGTSCGPDKGKDDTTTKLMTLLALSAPANGTIQFSISAGTNEISCSTHPTVNIAGTAGTQLKDARFYVSNIKLVKPDGSTVPVTLIDNNFQDAASGTAFLDFENGACTTTATGADATTNTSVSMTYPAGTQIVGIEFDVGIPDAANRLNYGAASAIPAFQSSAMYWSWASAYKFTKIEVYNPAGTNALAFHLGSTGSSGPMGVCDNASPSGAYVPNPCVFQNRPTVRLTASTFSLTQNKVNLDLAALIPSGYTWGTNCMSGRTTGTLAAACTGLFANIGVDGPTGASLGTQTAFSIH